MATLKPNTTVAVDGVNSELNNINLLQPTAFKLVIDRKHYKNLEFFCQSVLHPSATLSATEMPFKRANIAMTGDKLTFGELSAMVILDENMNSYVEMYNWMNRLVEQKDDGPLNRDDTVPPTYSDITVSILSSHNNLTRRIRYIDCIPTTIGDLSLETTTTQQYLTFPISFKFSYFELT